MAYKNEWDGKWKVINLNNNNIIYNGLSYSDAVKMARDLYVSPTNWVGGEPTNIYDIMPSRRRKHIF